MNLQPDHQLHHQRRIQIRDAGPLPDLLDKCTMQLTVQKVGGHGRGCAATRKCQLAPTITPSSSYVYMACRSLRRISIFLLASHQPPLFPVHTPTRTETVQRKASQVHRIAIVPVRWSDAPYSSRHRFYHVHMYYMYSSSAGPPAPSCTGGRNSCFRSFDK